MDDRELPDREGWRDEVQDALRDGQVDAVLALLDDVYITGQGVGEGDGEPADEAAWPSQVREALDNGKVEAILELLGQAYNRGYKDAQGS